MALKKHKKVVFKRRKDRAEVSLGWPGPDMRIGRKIVEEGRIVGEATHGADAERRWMHTRLEGVQDYEVSALWREMYGKDSPDGTPRWIMELGLEYGASLLGARRTGGKLTDTEYRRWKLCRDLQVDAMKKESDTWKYMDCNLRSDNHKGGRTMAKKTESKKEARVTASSVLIPILSRANVPTNDEIIETVREETGSSKFDAKQLAWYMWKFRQGKLKGMDGKLHVINQKKLHAAKADKGSKKSKKVVVVKKHK